jgi:DNA-binding transcriptional ArsR family regulator
MPRGIWVRRVEIWRSCAITQACCDLSGKGHAEVNACAYYSNITWTIVMNSDDAVTALAALAQEARLALFRLLVQAGEQGMTVGALASSAGLAMNKTSFHLRTLAHANLVQVLPEGRFVRYVARFDRMHALRDYLGENCCGSNPQACAPGAAQRDAPPQTSTATRGQG